MRHTPLLALVVVAVALASACSTPLASRRARVQQKGTAELAVVPAVDLNVLNLESAYPTPLPHAEAGVRFGVLDRTDVQLKINELFTPEIGVGYQLVGDPAANDFALTLGAGVRPGFQVVGSRGGSLPDLAPNLSVPLQILVDIPLYDDACITAAARTIFGYDFALPDLSNGLTVSPGLSLGATFPFAERLFLRPELAANVSFIDGAPRMFNGILGVGIGMTLGDPKK